MKTSITQFIVLAVVAPLFLSFNTGETKPGTNTQPENHFQHIEKVWTAGADYSKNSKPATYTEYHPNNCVTIFSDDNAYVGSAHLSRIKNGKVTISIALSDGWQLVPGDESIKIQGYSTAPKSKPNPAQFTYKGNNLIVEVDASKYYGIQLEVGM